MGLACPGTALETPTVTVAGKAFLFLAKDQSQAHLRLKLGPSLAQAKSFAQENPTGAEVGQHGWIKLNLSALSEQDLPLLLLWVAESHLLLAPKKLQRKMQQSQAAP